MAHMGDGCRFHVDRYGVGPYRQYAAEFIRNDYKDIALSDESSSGSEAGENIVGQRGGETWRATCGVAGLCAGSAPHIVIGDAVGHNDIKYRSRACPTGDTGVDHEVGMEAVYQGESADCRIHFADTAFGSDDLMLADATGMECDTVGGDGCTGVDHWEQKSELL